MATLVALLVVAGWQWQQARLQRNEAERQRDTARVQLLAIEARRANKEAYAPDDIERAAALALESIELAHKSNRTTEADAVETVRSALSDLPLGVLSHGSQVWSLAVLPDGRLASSGADGNIKIWPKDGAGEPVILSQCGTAISLR